MDIMQALILGIVQGLGEFLPISSTAHLVLVPYLFGWQDPGLAFDVALHVGTLVAVLAYFWKDWLKILVLGFAQIKNPVSMIASGGGADGGKYSTKTFWLLIVASVPGGIIGYLLEDAAETTLRSPLLIAFALSFVGLVLFLVDRYAVHRKNLGQMTIKDSIVIGVCQAIAIVPGVSRSGATMTAGLALGLSREAAARFSFLLSTPIIFGAAAFKVPVLVQNGISLPLAAGVLSAAFSGYLAIKYMLKFIQKVGYAPFFYYRLVLAAAIAIFYLAS